MTTVTEPTIEQQMKWLRGLIRIESSAVGPGTYNPAEMDIFHAILRTLKYYDAIVKELRSVVEEGNAQFIRLEASEARVRVLEHALREINIAFQNTAYDNDHSEGHFEEIRSIALAALAVKPTVTGGDL